MIHDTEALVCVDIRYRQQLGLNKYGTTVAQNPLELRQWLEHQYQELLDAAIYCKRAIQELDATLEKPVQATLWSDRNPC
jgi:hypothetical protein